MSAADPLLDRDAVETSFRALGDRLVRRGVVADLYVFVGAAMALAYDARRRRGTSTRSFVICRIRLALTA
ncbi:hypothetical protein GCM10010399_53500 [Dactylosporangium fulvum]